MCIGESRAVQAVHIGVEEEDRLIVRELLKARVQEGY